MRRHALAGSLVLVVGGLAVAAHKPPPAPVQITRSTGDSFVARMGVDSSAVAAIRSNGDLVAGGNLDGSHEVYELLPDNSLEQATASAGDSSAVRFTRGGLLVISSNANLGGNADGSYETWIFHPAPAPGSLEQITASAGDSFFQTFWSDGRKAFFTSKGDLTPGAPGNADGSNEVYSYDLDAKTFTQITNSTRNSLLRGVCANESCAVVESQGDLAPGAPGNADANRELFLVALDGTNAIKQITNSAVDSHYRGQDATGRFIGIESRGDLTPGEPGNVDGSQEVFVYDRTAKRLVQVTNSDKDSFFDGFVPHSRLVLVETTADLVPPRNSDGSREIFSIDVVTRRIVQQTASAGDSYFVGFAGDKNGLGAVVSNGDLTGRDKTGVDPAYQAWMTTFGGKLTRGRRLTNGATDSNVVGFDPTGKYVAVESSADLVPGGNADLSKEVFVAHATGSPKLKQVTSSAVESTFGGFTRDGRTMLVNSRGDLVGDGGNTDGSFEVFRVAYR